MNTVELYRVLLPFQKRNIFKGVFASDALPSKFTLPAAFVINLSPKTEKGTHWIGLYIKPNGTAHYFDSYGFPPKNTSIRNFIRLHSNKLKYNKRQLQHLSSVKCGKFVCLFIVFKMYRKSFGDLVDKLSYNLAVNDVVIENIFKYLRNCTHTHTYIQ